LSNYFSAGLFDRLANSNGMHSRNEDWWDLENQRLFAFRPKLKADLQMQGGTEIDALGFMPFSFVEMGVINTLDLFGLDELILFAFYWVNRGRYKRVVDMGANIGLHSVVLARMGYSVISYEPDPNHVKQLSEHVSSNCVEDLVNVREAAVSETSGALEFVRVLGNTTGSHVAGAKSNPYGALERIRVEGTAFSEAIIHADLVKMDVEGLEASLLQSQPPDVYSSTDIICEVGSADNADAIWHHLNNSRINLFPQKLNWEQAKSAQDLPSSYREGSLFLSSKSSMPW